MRISDWSSDVCSSDLLDHPAETVGLVRLGVHIEALVVLRPGVPALADGVALVVALLGMAVEGAGEVAVKVLLGHQVGAPGRDAAGAVVDGADAPAAARVGGGLQAIVPGGRAGQFPVRAAGGHPGTGRAAGGERV